MGAEPELGLLSPLPQLQKLAQSQAHPPEIENPPGPCWMWNPNMQATTEEDESWEVRAFAQDTNHAMGTTWPPRSYTCTFCRREFRSAQALGGHMNVHRRERARLHQAPSVSSSSSASAAAAAPSTLIIPSYQEFINSSTSGALCFLYSLPNPNGIFSPTSMMNNAAAGMDTSPTLSISQCPQSNNLVLPYPPPLNFPVTSPSIVNSSLCHQSSAATDPLAWINNDNDQNYDGGSTVVGELDLELRLGRSS